MAGRDGAGPSAPRCRRRPVIRPAAARMLDWYVSYRRRAWEHVIREPIATQERTLRHLVHRARRTQFGREHDFGGVRSIVDYQARVPLRDYLEFKPWLERSLAGHADVLWPGRTRLWVKTSGT